MKKIVLYGDSNTYGYDPCGILDRRYPKEDRWPDLLAGNPEWDIRAYGLNGRTLPRNNAEFAYLDQILMNTAPFDLLVIMLGSNDLLYMMEPDIRYIAECADRMLSYLLGRFCIQGDGSKILLLAPPPFQIKDPYSAKHVKISQDFAATYHQLSEARHTHFADVGQWNISIAYDGVHFTEAGHHTFAKQMDAVLTDIFTPRSEAPL